MVLESVADLVEIRQGGNSRMYPGAKFELPLK